LDMLTLINTNKMTPLIGPIGIDYVATAVRKAGFKAEVLDLSLSPEPDAALKDYFSKNNPRLIGLSFRNVDDCFWPSAKWFVPDLADMVSKIRAMTDAPIVLGGVGFSIFAEKIVEYTGADFGIRGDGEQAAIELLGELRGAGKFERVAGLIWHDKETLRSNKPAWPDQILLPTSRDAVGNLAYFNKGGQCGLETKRGCDRHCIYCVDRLAKGTKLRLRDPREIADEAESLLSQQISVLHLCDAEFNIPRSHAIAVCREFSRRSIEKKLSWYAYLAVKPFDAELAMAMRQAGCVGINFTGDSACPLMLKTYRQPHSKQDLASAVRLCKANGIKVMIDLLLGGPGETPETLQETINFIKEIDPHCCGASLGIRIYPDTEMAEIVKAEGQLEQNPNLHRKYEGEIDFFKPTFYISSHLGARPAKLVRDIIGGDKRFFEPMEELPAVGSADNPSTDHNYNDNTELVKAIEAGARGAYWDILRNLRGN
jgi:radical SAM superfamily enzyme YgiQ (UPF0313 family)